MYVMNLYVSSSVHHWMVNMCMCVCVYVYVCICVSNSPGSPDTGSPAAVLCRRPRYCPPCASLHVAELRRKMKMMMMMMIWRKKHFQLILILKSTLFSWHHLKKCACTFVEVQLLVLLILLLLLGVILSVGVVVVVVGDPLDLPTRLLPLPALVERGLRRFLDEVIRLRLSQDGGPLALEEQLRRANRGTVH